VRENTTDVDSGIAVAYFFLFILTIKCFNTSRARSQEDIGAESRRKRDPLCGTVVSFPQKCATIDLKIYYKMIKRLGLNFWLNWLKNNFNEDLALKFEKLTTVLPPLPANEIVEIHFKPHFENSFNRQCILNVGV